MTVYTGASEAPIFLSTTALLQWAAAEDMVDLAGAAVVGFRVAVPLVVGKWKQVFSS